ncbi:unnamed protein product [Allacma fusca]|uniref:Uncharacterized protein n=1 Tax=Allacma fusca TaxID=39272 RepID=A0A8J2PJP5_9HEXA|nr:unnamed protein product [Allacma fusca]
MDEKEKRAVKAQEMLKHVQESMKQLQNLTKTSLLNISESKDPTQGSSILVDESGFNNELLTLNSIKLSSSTPSQLFETRVFACPQLESTPVHYLSIKDTLDSFLYDQQDPIDVKDLRMDAMALELKELTTVQEQTLHSLTSDLDTLVMENKFLSERNHTLLSENEKLQQLVENLSIETTELKNHILSMRSNTLSFETFQGNNAGTSAEIPYLNTGIDVSLCTDYDTESPKRYSDASTYGSTYRSGPKTGVLECPGAKEIQVDGDNFHNIHSQGNCKFVSTKGVSYGDSAPQKVDKEKRKNGKGFLKLFRRHRKGKYNLN